MDRISRGRRSRNMAAIRSRNTLPEVSVRRILRSMGVRYRSHRRIVCCRPDLVLSEQRKAIFVHGCFWHGHEKKLCPRWHEPKSNIIFWKKKILRNKTRDAVYTSLLKKSGWHLLVVWECETRDKRRLERRLKSFIKK